MTKKTYEYLKEKYEMQPYMNNNIEMKVIGAYCMSNSYIDELDELYINDDDIYHPILRSTVEAIDGIRVRYAIIGTSFEN